MIEYLDDSVVDEVIHLVDFMSDVDSIFVGHYRTSYVFVTSSGIAVGKIKYSVSAIHLSMLSRGDMSSVKYVIGHDIHSSMLSVMTSPSPLKYVVCHDITVTTQLY